jgi:hypothetical protein
MVCFNTKTAVILPGVFLVDALVITVWITLAHTQPFAIPIDNDLTRVNPQEAPH